MTRLFIMNAVYALTLLLVTNAATLAVHHKRERHDHQSTETNASNLENQQFGDFPEAFVLSYDTALAIQSFSNDIENDRCFHLSNTDASFMHALSYMRLDNKHLVLNTMFDKHYARHFGFWINWHLALRNEVGEKVFHPDQLAIVALDEEAASAVESLGYGRQCVQVNASDWYNAAPSNFRFGPAKLGILSNLVKHRFNVLHMEMDVAVFNYDVTGVASIWAGDHSVGCAYWPTTCCPGNDGALPFRCNIGLFYTAGNDAVSSLINQAYNLSSNYDVWDQAAVNIELAKWPHKVHNEIKDFKTSFYLVNELEKEGTTKLAAKPCSWGLAIEALSANSLAKALHGIPSEAHGEKRDACHLSATNHRSMMFDSWGVYSAVDVVSPIEENMIALSHPISAGREGQGAMQILVAFAVSTKRTIILPKVAPDNNHASLPTCQRAKNVFGQCFVPFWFSFDARRFSFYFKRYFQTSVLFDGSNAIADSTRAHAPTYRAPSHATWATHLEDMLQYENDQLLLVDVGSMTRFTDVLELPKHLHYIADSAVRPCKNSGQVDGPCSS